MIANIQTAINERCEFVLKFRYNEWNLKVENIATNIFKFYTGCY